MARAFLCVRLPAVPHVRLKELSVALEASDAEGSPFKAIAFEGTNPYPVFVPNAFKANKGCDGKAIATYYRYAVKEEVCVRERVCTSENDVCLARP